VHIVVIGHQVGEGPCRVDNAVCVLVEKFEEVAFFGQQFAKQHGKTPDNGTRSNVTTA
jgi:hypothetical protein